MAIRPRENDQFEVGRDSEGRFYAVAKNFNWCMRSGRPVSMTLFVSLSPAASFLPSARMRSEGTVVGSVCLCVCVSVTLHLTSPMFVRLTNDTT